MQSLELRLPSVHLNGMLWDFSEALQKTRCGQSRYSTTLLQAQYSPHMNSTGRSPLASKNCSTAAGTHSATKKLVGKRDCPWEADYSDCLIFPFLVSFLDVNSGFRKVRHSEAWDIYHSIKFPDTKSLQDKTCASVMYSIIKSGYFTVYDKKRRPWGSPTEWRQKKKKSHNIDKYVHWVCKQIPLLEQMSNNFPNKQSPTWINIWYNIPHKYFHLWGHWITFVAKILLRMLMSKSKHDFVEFTCKCGVYSLF